MQAPPLQAWVKAATGMLVGPEEVELAGVAKSTWDGKKCGALAPRLSWKLGAPAGGAVVPSRSAGRMLATVVPSWKQTWAALAAPLIIAARSQAQVLTPPKVAPLLKML